MQLIYVDHLPSIRAGTTFEVLLSLAPVHFNPRERDTCGSGEFDSLHLQSARTRIRPS